MIEITNVSKHFSLTKKQQKESGSQSNVSIAVDSINLTCQPGRVFSLLGPNGAGKTTTLRMIASLLQPTTGTIHVCGLDTVEHPNEVRSKIGFLTGSTGLYERLTPDEIIDYFGALHGMSKTNLLERKNHLFEFLDVHPFKHKRIGKLSTGMRQKVSICRTMIHDPEVVVFDEPTSGLDVITAKNIIQLISDCRKQGKTVIFSSHIMSEVDLLCDDLAIIHRGKLLYNGTLDHFKNNMVTDGLTSEFIHIIEKSALQ